MAMLAEPRRKQRIGPNPRGKFFTEDDDNRGRQMLLKMGWSNGDGLGASMQGMSNPIKPKINTESRGLGFDMKEDPWVAHNDEFEELLKNLNSASNSSTGEISEAKKESDEEETLEKKSKASRSRIHYHKFVKNKDLSSASSSDISCIFGKPIHSKVKINTSVENFVGVILPKEKRKYQQNDPTDLESSVGSVSDPPKKKKKKMKEEEVNNVNEINADVTDDFLNSENIGKPSSDEVVKKKKKRHTEKLEKLIPEEIPHEENINVSGEIETNTTVMEVNLNPNATESSSEEVIKKKKKKKRHAEESEQQITATNEITHEDNLIISKTIEINAEVMDANLNTTETNSLCEEVGKKKRKKKRHAEESEQEITAMNEIAHEDNVIISKTIEINAEVMGADLDTTETKSLCEEVGKKKRKKKRHAKEIEEPITEEIIDELNINENLTMTDVKKKKKSKFSVEPQENSESIVENENGETEANSEIKRKKKKHKKNKNETRSGKCDEIHESTQKTPEPAKETKSGMQFINSGTIDDYFRRKMHEMKMRRLAVSETTSNV